jgi:hypothetical protein
VGSIYGAGGQAEGGRGIKKAREEGGQEGNLGSGHGAEQEDLMSGSQRREIVSEMQDLVEMGQDLDSPRHLHFTDSLTTFNSVHRA